LLSEDERALLILGRVLREAREQHGLSADDLAAATGIAHERISALEAGQLDPPYDVMAALADALGVRLGFITKRAEELGRQDEPQ
jgi:transcriptional regulator with XRE-family HTH domain